MDELKQSYACAYVQNITDEDATATVGGKEFVIPAGAILPFPMAVCDFFVSKVLKQTKDDKDRVVRTPMLKRLETSHVEVILKGSKKESAPEKTKKPTSKKESAPDVE